VEKKIEIVFFIRMDEKSHKYCLIRGKTHTFSNFPSSKGVFPLLRYYLQKDKKNKIDQILVRLPHRQKRPCLLAMTFGGMLSLTSHCEGEFLNFVTAAILVFKFLDGVLRRVFYIRTGENTPF